jgi:hypothetical protein
LSLDWPAALSKRFAELGLELVGSPP